MMTNPNTLGLFEDEIPKIAAAVHAAGGLMYYDGANATRSWANARPGDMGFDLMHLNTHKTFTIPHGGGGRGPRAARRRGALVEYLPTPIVGTPIRTPSRRWSATGSLSARLRPAEVDRTDAFVLVELRARGARARVHLR